MLVIKIDAVGSEALQRFLDYFLDVLWLAVKSTDHSIVEAEFRCDNDLVAERRERFSDKFLICIWTVNFGCIKERDAFVMGCTNDFDALVSARRQGRSWR